VFATLVAAQVAVVLAVDQRAPDVTRAWRTFAIAGIRDGVQINQTFDIGYGGLSGIDIVGDTPPSNVTRYVDARLAGPDGGEQVTRTATIAIPAGQTTCCRIAFARIPTSGRRFRLELRFRGFDRATPLSLQAHAVRIQGGLRVNDRTQPANLAMRPDGVIEHLPGAMRISLIAFAAALLGVDALVAAAVAIACCRPRP
jgi:hypothetical protein